MKCEIHGQQVRGVEVGSETRCDHYHTERDVVALRFACCGEYYPCFQCHEEVVDHPTERLPVESSAFAVLCGVCGLEMTPEEFVDSDAGDDDHRCPDCSAKFNPGCADHYDRYFEFGEQATESPTRE